MLNEWVTTQLDNVFFVDQAIDSTLYQPKKYVKREPNLVVSVGRRQALKGFSELGEYSRRLGSMKEDARLVLFGGDRGISLIGAFSGVVAGLSDLEVVELYNTCSVYVCTSQHEGFGLPLIEAMACGTPVVTTNCEGNMAFCVDGENSIVVDKKDMKGLAQATVEVMNDPQLRKRLVDGGFETAKRYFDWDGVIDNLETFLTQK